MNSKIEILKHYKYKIRISSLDINQLLKKSIVNAFIITITISIISIVNVGSVAPYLYHLLWGLSFILLIDRKEVGAFFYAFLINAFFTSLYIAIQSYIYPDTYGTTSPLNLSWTDDSYFFALCADIIPNRMYVRDSYWEYTHFYAEILKFITPFNISHPLDVIFFQSCTSAILSIYTRQFAVQTTNNTKIGNIVYNLCIFSPFLLMNGGVILIRDTLVAALFMVSLSLFNRKRYFLALIAMVLQFPTRIGTGFILLLLLIFMYLPAIKSFIFQRKYLTLFPIIMIGLITQYFDLIISYFELDSFLLQKGVTYVGREVFGDLEGDENVNVIFLFIQKQNVLLKIILSSLYIFLYPFLSFKGVLSAEGFDIRTFLLSVISPIGFFALNAYFFSAYLSLKREYKHLLLSIIFGFMLIGVFSLQTRHKTILLPLYFIVVAIGYEYSTKNAKKIGLILSSIWLITQVVLTFR